MKEITADHFIKYTFPKVWSKEWVKIINKGPDIKLSNKTGEVVISKRADPKTLIESISAFDGTLTAYYTGEWGGYLEYERDGFRSIIMEGCIRFIFQFDGGIFFIDSLSHLNLNFGYLYRLTFQDSNFQFELVLDLSESIEAMVIVDELSIVAISDENLFLIKKDGSEFRKKVLISKFKLESTYPNSIVTKGNGIFLVGMRGGIGKFDTLTATVEYFKYFNDKGQLGGEILELN